MFNYDSLANTDDGSCEPFVYGCMDSTMFNFNPLANAQDTNNPCVPYIYGCTDPSMFNYQAEANTEDFSCIPFMGVLIAPLLIMTHLLILITARVLKWLSGVWIKMLGIMKN